MKRLALLALLASATFAHAQTKADPRVLSCDPLSALLNSPTIFDVGRATVVKACPSFEKGAANFLAANLDSLRKMTGEQAIQWMLHGPIVLPPKDTVVVPPPVVVDTQPTPPKDTVIATPPPAVVAWTKLGGDGNLWTFPGLRVVRYTRGDSVKALTTVAYGQIACGYEGFGNRAPAGSGAAYCEVGPALMDTLAVPQKMGPIFGSTIVTPKGSPGVSVEQVHASGGAGIKVDGTGSFRTTCELSKFIFDDPIVFPDTTGVSHLHMLFGNTAVTGKTNSLALASSGNSTCRGGILNRTAYWTPAVISASGNAVMPDRSEFYYKQGQFIKPATLIQTLPAGLKMVAGDKNATGKQTSPDGLLQKITWTCYNGTAKSPNDASIPACAAGDKVLLTVIFPQCWDGVNLDSPDHKSHVAYPEYASNGGSLKPHCPSTHPVAIPEITEHFYWPVEKGANPATWHLSSDMDLTKPGGLSAHADWMNGWDPATMLLIVQNCLQKALDCEIGGLGGRILY